VRAANLGLVLIALFLGGSVLGALVGLPTAWIPKTEDGASAPEVLRYWAIPQVSVAGAPALPLVPLEVSPNGILLGNATTPDGPGWFRDGYEPSILAPFRTCGPPTGKPGFTEPGNGTQVLRYADLGTVYGNESRYPDRWYENRSGQPIEPGALPPNRSVVALWRSPPNASARTAILVHVVNLTTPNEGPIERAFRVDGITAFGVRVPGTCGRTEVTIPANGNGTQTPLPHLETHSAFVTNPARAGVWTPAWTVPETFVVDASGSSSPTVSRG
jgi:hypothetical protein